MSCNGCGEGSEGPRYIAINCRPGFIRGDVLKLLKNNIIRVLLTFVNNVSSNYR
jgi:hypothetical protein